MRKEDLNFDVIKYPVKDTELVAWVQTMIGVYEGHIDGVVFPDAIGSQDRSTYTAKTKVTNAMKQSYGTSYLQMYNPVEWFSINDFHELAKDTDIDTVSALTRSRADKFPVYANGVQIIAFALKEMKIPATIIDKRNQYVDLVNKFNKDKKNFSDADLATLQDVDTQLENYFSKGI